ncbi:LytR C-terminal domain-containing protein [Nocardioides terrisoli]|uniref:LytR C-terminal domain-containing protein n=1 Tax=Nocardioides terrisoli TaxID=3388267 RepID=UPI00287BA29D|nr:LytR C-terminal domain-containing protein [Nocardioides marmorisolisilvae]
MIGRRITTTLTMVALIVVLGVMAVWGYRAATAPLPQRHDASTSTCSKAEISKQIYVHRKDVTVSVYNAGAPTGFARLTLQRLENLGFAPGSVGNAPTHDHVTRAQVLTTKKGDTAAKLVARTLGGHPRIKVVADELGPGIDVYVGAHMHHLDNHAPKRLKLPKPIEHCVPVD